MDSPATVSAAPHTQATSPGNVLEFKPRPSALVHRELALREIPGDTAVWRHLREWARHACVASDKDKRGWKVDAGEVYTREHPASVAERLGVSLGHVYNVMTAMRREGLIETRRCSPKRMSVVFLLTDEVTRERSDEGPHEDSSVPRSVPRQIQRSTAQPGGTATQRHRTPPRREAALALDGPASNRQVAMAACISRKLDWPLRDWDFETWTRRRMSQWLREAERIEAAYLAIDIYDPDYGKVPAMPRVTA